MRYVTLLLLHLFLLAQFQPCTGKEGDNLQLAKESENPLAKLAVVPIRLNIYPNVNGTGLLGGPVTGSSSTSSLKGPKGKPLTSCDLYSKSSKSLLPPPPPPPKPFKGTLNTYDINPTYPIALSKKEYLLLRWQQAISFAEDVYAPHSSQNGLGDANPSVYYVYAVTNNLMLGVGPAIVIPTATTHFLGLGKWCLGPSVTGVWTPGRWVVGGIAQNIFSVAGAGSRPDLNIMTIQPLVNYNFDHGWFFTSNPYWIANWNNPKRDKWTIPIGGGFGKLFTLGKQAMTFSVAVYGYPVKPTGGPDYSIRLTLQYLFPQEQKKEDKKLV